MAKHSIRTPVGGSVCSHSVGIGQRTLVGTTILVCEVMKTEFPVEATIDGTIMWLRPCGETVEVDDIVAIINDDAA
jgi:biotin carboxyl carrier protein